MRRTNYSGAILGAALLAATGLSACGDVPDDADTEKQPGDMEIEADPQIASQLKSKITRWRIQVRKSDFVVLGLDKGGKTVIRSKYHQTIGKHGVLMTITKPKVYLISAFGHGQSGRFFTSKALDSETRSYLNQMQMDLQNGKWGFQSAACGISAAACVWKTVKAVYTANPLEIPEMILACAAAVVTCDLIDMRAEESARCQDMTEQYGIPMDCSGVPLP